MVLDRRSAPAGLLACLLVAGALGGVVGCGGSSGSTAERPSTSATVSTSAGISTSAGADLPTPAGSPPAGGVAASPSRTISIPPYLCTGTDVAQNAADAYMGALSAGQLDQATACVLPGTVPAAVTRGLLAGTGTTATYLPRDGVDGPSVFGYRGAGKLVDVTVSKEADGRFWVTGVAVRSG